MNGETVTIVTVDGFVNPIVVVVVFLKNGEAQVFYRLFLYDAISELRSLS